MIYHKKWKKIEKKKNKFALKRVDENSYYTEVEY